MRKKIEKFNPSIVFVISLLVLVIPLAYYIFLWVPDQQAQLSDRYLRVAAMMSEQIETRGKNISTVIENSNKSINESEPAKIEKELNNWLTLLLNIPGIKLQNVGFKKKNEVNEHFSIDVDYNPGDDIFKFDIKKDIEISDEIKSVNFKALIKVKDFVGEICQSEEFEDVLIIDEKDEIIYTRDQHVQGGIKSGLRISRIKTLFRESVDKTKNNKNKEKSESQIVRDALHSYIIDINIAQTDYKIFIQPIPLKFIKPGHTGNSEKHWFVGGLLPTDTFMKRSRKISNHILLIFILLLSMAFIGYPLIKLLLIGPGDRVRARDVIFLGLSLIVGIPMVIFSIITASVYSVDKANCSRDLQQLAQNIHDRFTGEIQIAHEQLSFVWENKDDFLFRENNKDINRRPDLLEELARGDNLKYPYFDMIFIMDENGKQKYKRVVDKSPITFHDVSHREYFKKIKNKSYWYTGNDKPMMLEPVYSKSTGRYELNLSIPLKEKTDVSSGQLNENDTLVAAGMSFRPLSVINPVLPHNYGFAIIDRDGKVLFHSDLRLNSNENFFSECDKASTVKAAIFARAEDWMQVSYQGKRWDLYLMPIRNTPWTISVFRDRDVRGSRTLERIFRAGQRYILYMSALILLLLFFMFLSYTRKVTAGIRIDKLHKKFRWLWPEKKFRLKYAVMTLLNLVIFFLLLIQLYILETSLSGLLVIPVIALILGYLTIMKAIYNENSRENNKKIRNSRFYRNSHTLVICSFLLLLFAYPSLMFYKIAYKEEKTATVKYNQVILARSFIKWDDWRKKNYKAQEESIPKEWGEVEAYAKGKGIYTLPSYNSYMINETKLKEWQAFEKALLASERPYQLTPFDLIAIELKQISDKFFKRASRTNFLQFVSEIIPFDNKYSEKIRYLYQDVSADSSFKWRELKAAKTKKMYLKYYEKPNLQYNENAKEVDPFYVVSEIPGMKGEGGNIFRLSIGAFFTLLFLTVILYAIVRFIGKFIFLRDLGISPGEKSVIFNDEMKLVPGRFFVFGQAAKAVKKDCQKKDCMEIDCKENGFYETFKQSVSPPGNYIVITNFDYMMHDYKANLVKLDLLERLVISHDLNVVVFSQFEPLQYFALPGNHPGNEKDKKTEDSEPGAEDIFNRWKRLLSHFDFLYGVERPKRKKLTENIPEDLKTFIDNECADSEYLFIVRDQVFSELKRMGSKEIGLPWIKDRIYEYARPIYDAIWRASTKNEKLVLIRLAQDGLVNIKNKEGIRRLLKRRLISLSPLRLINTTFKDYINSTEDRDTILKWKMTQVDSNWTKVRRPFIFLITGVILFLVITQPGVLKSWLVLIPAISAGIPALLRTFDHLSGSSGEN